MVGEKVGVIIARFQVPYLHKAHRALINFVTDKHKKTVICIGVSPVKLTRNNPLDFMTREMMIKAEYPGVFVVPVKDAADNGFWSVSVDHAIESVIGDSGAILYGSRDSFIPHYSGRYETCELPSTHKVSGTEIRESVSMEIRANKAYRTGVIYAAYNHYPISYQCVDAIIWREKDGLEILLGRKKMDAPNKFRFPGGFSSPSDPSLEFSVSREVQEEAGGISTHEPKYLFSQRVDDWRYRKEADKIMTAVFSVQYMFGKEEAKDDLDGLEWFKIGEVEKVLVKEHESIWEKAKQTFHLQRK